MTTEDRNLALRAAILEWQKKYGIRDGDPMLATLELFHIYFEGLQGPDAATAQRPLLFEEFRGSLELVDERAKSFVKQSAELIGGDADLFSTPGAAPFVSRFRYHLARLIRRRCRCSRRQVHSLSA